VITNDAVIPSEVEESRRETKRLSWGILRPRKRSGLRMTVVV